MAKGLAQQSGGELLIDSVLGQGTRVTILLPQALDLARLTAGPGPGVLSELPALDIILVDDEPLVRSSVARMLRDLGHEVREASSGPEALEILALEAPDLLVTDHAMPGMTGAALAVEARGKVADLPVLLMSGYAALAGMEGEALPCLAKPFTLAALSEALARTLSPRYLAPGLDIAADREK
jgi:CheY-like chemotaxis protein